MVNYIRPYKDEILYSILARYISRYGTTGPKQLLEGIFNTDKISSTLDLPSGLTNLSNTNLVYGLSLSEIISNHTMFPLYHNFISSEKANLVLHSMKQKSGDVHTRVGINAGSISCLDSPRYCPQCYCEDIRSNKEPYLRRAHQIPGIEICTDHNVFLHSFSRLDFRYNKHRFVSFDELYPIQNKSENSNQQLLLISEKVKRLLSQKTLKGYNHQPYFYNDALKNVGFLKGEKSINIENLYAEFTSYYSSGTLKAFQSEVDINNESCWLKMAARKHRKDFNPIRHILLQNFINQFQKASSAYAVPIKKVCRNPVCPDYNFSRNTEVSFKVDAKSKREITHVICGCGYHYTESYNLNKEAINRSVRDFGEVWRKSCNDLLYKNLPMREIARKLHCDSKTVLSQTKRPEKQSKSNMLFLKRKGWIAHQNNYPDKSITQLRKLMPALYTYIYRNDKEWLLNQKYPIHEKTGVKSDRVNWIARDREWKAIMQVKLKELKSSDFENRISRTLLLKLLQKEASFKKHKYRLPLCVEFIEKNEESFHEYRKRRIFREAQKAKVKSLRIKKWELIRRAGIRKEYINDDLEIYIDSMVEQSNFNLSLALAS